MSNSQIYISLYLFKMLYLRHLFAFVCALMAETSTAYVVHDVEPGTLEVLKPDEVERLRTNEHLDQMEDQFRERCVPKTDVWGSTWCRVFLEQPKGGCPAHEKIDPGRKIVDTWETCFPLGSETNGTSFEKLRVMKDDYMDMDSNLGFVGACVGSMVRIEFESTRCMYQVEGVVRVQFGLVDAVVSVLIALLLVYTAVVYMEDQKLRKFM